MLHRLSVSTFFHFLLLLSFLNICHAQTINADNTNPQSSIHDRVLQGDLSAYDQWAASYDDNVQSWGWTGPKAVVTKLIELAQTGVVQINENTSVLDAGSGTGMVAQYMREKRFPGIIKGVDINAAMVNESIKKKVDNKPLYDEVRVADLLALDGKEKHDVILSSGVFLEGHCGPKHLQALLNTLSPDGLAIITIRKTFYDQNKSGFDNIAAHYTIQQDLIPDYIEGAQAYLWTIKQTV